MRLELLRRVNLLPPSSRRLVSIIIVAGPLRAQEPGTHGEETSPQLLQQSLSLVNWANKFHGKHGREPDTDDDVHTCAAQRKKFRTRNVDEKERTRPFCTVQ
jgi:hypothetical protein